MSLSFRSPWSRRPAGRKADVIFSVEVSPGDRVDIDDSRYSRWATVTDVHTAGVSVRHEGGERDVYLFSRVLDVEYRKRT